MGIPLWLLLLLLPLILLVVASGVWWLVHHSHVHDERARESFRLQHERLQEMLCRAAAETGKPRGLKWVSCTFTNGVVLTHEKRSRELVALVPTTIQFEPTPDGDMIEIEAATQPRLGTALFHFRKGHWATEGRVFFNSLPNDVIRLFHEQFSTPVYLSEQQSI
jgi:hypothetical protein